MDSEKKTGKRTSDDVSGETTNGDWVIGLSKSVRPGQRYYFNSKTGERCWSKPSGVKMNKRDTKNLVKDPDSGSSLDQTGASKQQYSSRRRKRRSERTVESMDTDNIDATIDEKKVRHSTDQTFETSSFVPIVEPKSSRKIEDERSFVSPMKRFSNIASDSSTFTVSTTTVDEDMPLAPALATIQEIDTEDSVEEMEVDEIIQVVNSARKEFDSNTFKVSSLNPVCTIAQSSERGGERNWETILTKQNSAKIFIIVDTNVFLSDLKFLDELERRSQNGSLRLVVPYVVLRELDYLKSYRVQKDNQMLSKHARFAITWISDQLMNANSHVIFQPSYADLRSVPDFKVSCNDDRILKCAYEIISHKPAILTFICTDDKNLINRGRIDGLRCANKEEAKILIRSLDESSSLLHVNNNSTAIFESPDLVKSISTIPVQNMPPSQSSNGLTEMDDIITACKDFLSEVAEKEMKRAFDDQWIDIVKIKPPWKRLTDVLNVFIQHWIAVFTWMFNERNSAKQDLEALYAESRNAIIFGKEHVQHASMLQRLLRVMNNFNQRCNNYQNEQLRNRIQTYLKSVHY